MCGATVFGSIVPWGSNAVNLIVQSEALKASAALRLNNLEISKLPPPDKGWIKEIDISETTNIQELLFYIYAYKDDTQGYKAVPFQPGKYRTGKCKSSEVEHFPDYVLCIYDPTGHPTFDKPCDSIGD